MVMVDAMGPLVGAHISYSLLMIGGSKCDASQPDSAQASWPGEYEKLMRDPTDIDSLIWPAACTF